jgi:pentatricopeptide repeat protein
MNSLLQSLFMNRNFRRAVYLWESSDDDQVCFLKLVLSVLLRIPISD